MRLSRIPTGVVVLALLWNTGWSQDAVDFSRKPRFPYAVSGPDSLKEALRSNIATRPQWLIYGRIAAAQPVVFEVSSNREVRPSSYGLPPRGYAQTVLHVKAGGNPPFEISETVETPYVVAVTGKQSAYEVGFQQAENEALDKLMPYVCARLVRLSNDAAQTQALLKFIEKRWPEEDALLMLRGLGPAAVSWSDRIAALLETRTAAGGAPDPTLVVLLAVDEGKGSAVLAQTEHLRDRGIHLVGQHLEWERLDSHVLGRPGIPIFPSPWPKQLSPAAAEALTQWVHRYPVVAEVCAHALLEFNDDPRADALVRSLPDMAPDQAGDIRELIADQERYKQERLEDEKRERERAAQEKLDQQFADEEKAKQKPDEK